MSNLFLDGIFDTFKLIDLSTSAYFNENNSPSRAILYVPDYETPTKCIAMAGIIASEPSISGGNTWGTVLDDVSSLTQAGQIVGSIDDASWIGSSVQCWKSTSPIKIQIELILINYKRGLNLEKGLKALQKLTSVAYSSEVSVKVHGGYASNPLSLNSSFFTQKSEPDYKKGIPGEITLDTTAIASNFNDSNVDGTVMLQVGSKYHFRNLLVSTMNFVPSTVEVFDEVSGGVPKGRPLYYRLSVGMIGRQALVTSDVDFMFSNFN